MAIIKYRENCLVMVLPLSLCLAMLPIIKPPFVSRDSCL